MLGLLCIFKRQMGGACGKAVLTALGNLRS
jgi:hypothetical protein